MALSPATFYDDNGIVRLQGQLDGGGGTPSVSMLGPFTVNVTDGQGIVLWNAKAGDLIWQVVAVPTITWDGSASVEIYCASKDFVFPDNATMALHQDASRIYLLSDENSSAAGNTPNTPSIMRVDSDVICDVISPATTGQTKIYALVSAA